MLKVNTTDIFFDIRKGSTIVSGLVSAINEARALQIFNIMKKTDLPDFDIIVLGKSFSFINETKVVECQSYGKDRCDSEAAQPGLSVGAIVGIVIGSVVLLSVIAVTIYQVRKCQK